MGSLGIVLQVLGFGNLKLKIGKCFTVHVNLVFGGCRASRRSQKGGRCLGIAGTAGFQERGDHLIRWSIRQESRPRRGAAEAGASSRADSVAAAVSAAFSAVVAGSLDAVDGPPQPTNPRPSPTNAAIAKMRFMGNPFLAEMPYEVSSRLKIDDKPPSARLRGEFGKIAATRQGELADMVQRGCKSHFAWRAGWFTKWGGGLGLVKS